MESFRKGEIIEPETCGKGKVFEWINKISNKRCAVCSFEVYGALIVEVVAKKTVVLSFHTEFQLMESAQLDLVCVAERYPLIAIAEIIKGFIIREAPAIFPPFHIGIGKGSVGKTPAAPNMAPVQADGRYIESFTILIVSA